MKRSMTFENGWQVAAVLEHAADELQHGRDLWTDDEQDAYDILHKLAKQIRKATAKAETGIDFK